MFNFPLMTNDMFLNGNSAAVEVLKSDIGFNYVDECNVYQLLKTTISVLMMAVNDN